MQEINQENQNNEISLKELILKSKEWYHFLLSKWKTIFLAGILGGILGFTYAYFQKAIYTAETTFVLEDGDNGGGGLGAYAGLASIAGIDLGGGGGGIFQGDNILQLYTSRRMIQNALLSRDFSDDKFELIIDKYIAFKKLREKWENTPKLSKISFLGNPLKFNRLQDSLLSDIILNIKKNYLEVTKPDKKLSIISVKVNSENEVFSKIFVNGIVKTVNDFYVNTKTKKSTENLAVLQFQADSIKKVLNFSISGVAIAVDANPNSNPAFQTLRVPSQRKQIDVQSNAAAYQEILKNLELAKISLRKDKPLIQLIDEPVYPLKINKVGKKNSVLIGGVVFGFLSLITLILNRIFINMLNK